MNIMSPPFGATSSDSIPEGGTDWKALGYTTAVLFGRFQPVHLGHVAMIKAIEQWGLETHIFINRNVDTPDDRNPYNHHQRRYMMKLCLPHQLHGRIHSAPVYLGGGGDIGNDVRKLAALFEDKTRAPIGKIVFFCATKGEDRKDYLVDGGILRGIHYSELLIAPHGPLARQVLAPHMIPDFQEIDAKMWRRDHSRAELLDPKVSRYLALVHAQAEACGRPIHDVLDDLDALAEAAHARAGRRAAGQSLEATGNN